VRSDDNFAFDIGDVGDAEHSLNVISERRDVDVANGQFFQCNFLFLVSKLQSFFFLVTVA
jgi:hypothetical protein